MKLTNMHTITKKENGSAGRAARLISLALVIMLLMMTMASCGGSGGESGDGGTDGSGENTGAAITITDHAGNEVELPGEINRIAVCDIYPLPSVLATFFGSAEKLVGIPAPSMTAAENGLLGELYPEVLQAETGYIDGTAVNLEELAALEPDVVFYSASSPELGEQLRDAGFAAVAISVNKWDYNCIETLNNWIDLLSQMFPENDKAALVREKSEEMYERVQERVSQIPDEERATAFFLFQYNDTTLLTSGKQFFGQWWADAVGARNVAEELTQDNSVAVNMEQIYAWDPQVIFITNFNTYYPSDLYNNTVEGYDWSPVQAVKYKDVHKMPLGIYRSYTPGADCPVTLLWMAKATYPELFDDIDIIEEAKTYYKDVFGIELTDEQVKSIFEPAQSAGEGFSYQ